MGQIDSKDADTRIQDALNNLNRMELKDLEAVFLELSCKNEKGENIIKQPTWLNRDKFAQTLGTSEFLIEELFSAFDCDQNGVIDMQEFMVGMAFCLHGSVKKKSDLLFQIFNLDGDDGIDPKELSLVLTSCLQSAHSLLRKVSLSEGLCDEESTFLEDPTQKAAIVTLLVDKIVKDAFQTCDVSQTGKLNVDEFAKWVHKNPKLITNAFLFKCPKPSQEPGQSNPSFNFGDEHDDSESGVFQDLKNESADDTSSAKPMSLQDLFSQSNPDSTNFFDSIGTLQDNDQSMQTMNNNSMDTVESEGTVESTDTHSHSNISSIDVDISSNNVDNSVSDKSNNEDNYKEATELISEDNVQTDCHSDIPGETLDLEQDLLRTRAESCEVAVECLESLDGHHSGIESKADDLLDAAIDTSGTPIVYLWEPNAEVKQLLQQSLSGSQTEYKPVQPTMVVETFGDNPVKELLEKYLGEQEASKRHVSSFSHVDSNLDGLSTLLQNGCWRGALDFTGNYIGAHYSSIQKTGESLLNPTILQVWYIRIILLVRLRMFTSAEAEMDSFKDLELPDYFFQFYPRLYPGTEGSMIPFSFRLLNAEIPQYVGKPELCLDRLYSLLSKVNYIVEKLSNEGTELGNSNNSLSDNEGKDRLDIWHKRIIQIHFSLANCFLSMKEYLLTVEILEKIITLEPSRAVSILSLIGRMYLQFGDHISAQKYFKRIECYSQNDDLSMIEMNHAYTLLTKGLYKGAYQHFLTAHDIDKTNLAACNNAAVCLIFMGKVKEAGDILETMVCQSPDKSLHEEIILNLTTVYELETSRALQKKHKLLDLISKHKGDGFNVQCLKLS